MNQRHTADSPAPLAAPDWSITAADQRAVLDAAGVDRALLWGGCIGVGYCPALHHGDRPSASPAPCPRTRSVWSMDSTAARRSGPCSRVRSTAAHNGGDAGGGRRRPWPTRSSCSTTTPVPSPPASPPTRSSATRSWPSTPSSTPPSWTAWDERMWGAEGPFMSVPESFVSSLPGPVAGPAGERHVPPDGHRRSASAGKRPTPAASMSTAVRQKRSRPDPRSNKGPVLDGPTPTSVRPTQRLRRHRLRTREHPPDRPASAGEAPAMSDHVRRGPCPPRLP